MSGVDVYSLLQDHHGDILLSTDQGLKRYDGYDLHTYSNAAEKTKSLFGLSQSMPGKTWCFNLSGQIFCYEGDSLHLKHTLHDSLVSNMMAIQPLANGDLVISCRGLLLLHGDGRSTLLSPPGRPSYGTGITALPDGSFFHVPAISTKVFHQKGDVAKLMPLVPALDTSTMPSAELLSSDGGHFLRVGPSFLLYRLVQGIWQQMPLQVPPEIHPEFPIRMFQGREGDLWFLLSKRGLLRMDRQGRPREPRPIFRGHRLSCHLQDREGNTWLGTLGTGLLMVSNPEVRHYRTVSQTAEQKNRYLASDGAGRIFLGFDSGDIVEIGRDGQQSTLFSGGGRELKYLRYDPLVRLLCLSVDGDAGTVDPNNKAVELPQKFVYARDYSPAQGFGVMPATQGVFLSTSGKADFPAAVQQWPGFTRVEPGLAQIEGSRRSHSAHYDAAHQALYIGSVVDLQVLSAKGIAEVRWRGQPIIARAIVPLQGSLWVSSAQFGLLELRDGQVLRQVSTADGLLRRDIRKLLAWNGRLYLGFDRIIQTFDPATNKFAQIDQSRGLSGEPIVDFVGSDSTLWVAYAHALRAIPAKGLPAPSIPPLLRFTGIKVNGQARPFAPLLDLAHDQDQLDFAFVASDFRHQGTLRYAYRLLGEPSPTWKWLEQPQHSLSFSAMRPADYTLQIKAVNGQGTESAVISQHFRIAGPIWTRWWFILGAVLLFSAVGWRIYRAQIRRIQRENALQLENERVAKALVDSNLTALRAQMNPHFIFNALNSIQEFILTNEKKQATKYLGKFADLMRTYLQHSRQNAVRLSDEVAALRLYLELENLRFDDSLEIDLALDPALDAATVQIPSLLVQPFVENAIKHGLFNQRRPGPRRLSVQFRPGDGPSRLVCVIADNGIGRAAAAALQASNSLRHDSFATTSTQARLELLQRGGMEGLLLRFDDLHDAAGEACGTRVTLILPCL